MFPLWIKLGYTLMVGLILAVYWVRYGPGNFLWFSDVALISIVPALWLESSLLASMMAVSVLLPELAWNVDYFSKLITNTSPFGLSKYMFDETIPKRVRALSLFHIGLPPLLVWMVYRLGYDHRALLGQTLLGSVILFLSYKFADPRENVNWVRGLRGRPQDRLSGASYLLLLMLGFPLLVYLPTHLLLLWLLS